MQRTLLLVGGGLETLHGVHLAKARGHHVVVSDMKADAPAMRAADDCLVASTYDIDATVAAARRYSETVRRIDGVLSIGVDVPRTVAAVTTALGLRGITPAAAALSADKLAMKERFAKDGVPVPWFDAVDSGPALARLKARHASPLVVKPVDSRGSRGVQRLLSELDPIDAFEHAKAQSPTGRVMVEAYLSGPQISTETLVLAGIAHTPGFSDRNYELLDRYAPFFIENGGDLPSRLSRGVQGAVRTLIQQAAQSIGVREGMLKGDIVVHNGEPYVIEVATRLSGGYFCTLEIPLNTGVDFVGAVMDWALGETVDPARLVPRSNRPVVQRYLFLEPGEVTAVSGLEAARAQPNVAEVMLYVAPGDRVRAPTDTTARAAMAIATGDSAGAALASVRAALAALSITTRAASSAR